MYKKMKYVPKRVFVCFIDLRSLDEEK